MTTLAQAQELTAVTITPVKAVVEAPAEVKVEVKEVEKENPADFTEVYGVRADMLENSVRIHLANGMTRMISYADYAHTLLSFLDKAQETREGTVRLLPPNVYLIEESMDRLTLCFYFEETVRNVNFYGTVKARVVPNIIINVNLTRGTGSKKNDFLYESAYYYATNLPLSRLPATRIRGVGNGICQLPFTNVYNEGHLCTGQNSLIRDFPNNDLRQTRWFHDMLWASPFNYDLGVYAMRERTADRPSIEAWYEELARRAAAKEGFPYDRLQHLTIS